MATSEVTSHNPEETYDALKQIRHGTWWSRPAEHKLDPVIGRDEEIRNVIRILSSRAKNNPVLIGEPGVGQNSHCRGTCTQRIVQGVMCPAA